MSRITSAAQLLTAAERRRGTVDVRGNQLTIAELTLAGRDAFLAAIPKGQAATAAVLLEHGLINPDTGAPLLTAEEAETMQGSSAAFVQDVVSGILKLSGLNSDEGNA